MAGTWVQCSAVAKGLVSDSWWGMGSAREWGIGSEKVRGPEWALVLEPVTVVALGAATGFGWGEAEERGLEPARA